VADNGGGVWCASTNAFLAHCVIAGNSATFGGGAYGGTLKDCALMDNSATDGGGAMIVVEDDGPGVPDELKQLITIIESPINRKYQALGGEMQKALAEKLVAELRPSIEPKLRALQQTVAGRLAPAASGANGK